MGGLELALGGIVAAIFGAVLAYLRGRAAGKQAERGKAAQGYGDTRRKADEADIVGDDPDLARRWLRERPSDKP